MFGAQTQDRLFQLLGNGTDARSQLVAAMLRRDAREATSYWLQLVVSVGIATLGLVVGSAAVVIGAMLVAPLMGPIVGLAMGLATGSPFLVIRSSGRIVFSVLVAVGGAAIITLLLPFHETNAELAARASPTALDLVTAAFCALAGVYASLRPGSDTTTTAAGTSIGISLVPPLCACGYGVGTEAWRAAGGAGLLFLTNLVAIVVVGTVAFLAAGFNQVDPVAVEAAEVGQAEGSLARVLASRLNPLFASRWGPALRLAMPFLLLAAVYVPLRRALDEVAWQVRVRSAVRDVIAREPLRVVQSRVRVERHEVEIVVVLLATTAEADIVRTRMSAEVRQASGVAPRIEILAVPDASAFAGLESTLLAPKALPAAPPPPTESEQLAAAQARVRSAVQSLWPADAAGEPLSVDVGAAQGDPIRIRVVHLGAALAPDGLEALRRSLRARLGRDAHVVDVDVPTAELDRREGDFVFVTRVVAGLQATAGLSSVHVCVARPAAGRRASGADAELARALEQALAGRPNVTVAQTGAWTVRFSLSGCASPSAASKDGGADLSASSGRSESGRHPSDAPVDAWAKAR